MNSPAYLVAPAGTTVTARPAMASNARIGLSFIQLPVWSALDAIIRVSSAGRETAPAKDRA